MRKKKKEEADNHASTLFNMLTQLVRNEIPEEQIHMLFPGVELDSYERKMLADAYAHGNKKLQSMFMGVRIEWMMRWLEDLSPELYDKITAHLKEREDAHDCDEQKNVHPLEQLKDIIEDYNDDL